MKINLNTAISSTNYTKQKNRPLNFKSENRYLGKLAQGLSEYCGEKVNPARLSSVLDRTQFLEQTRKLKEHNYVNSLQNLKDGTFCADLHSHSIYSDGRIKISDMLEQACDYGNRLMHNFGKKFLFALTDHNEVDGVKEVLGNIAENPEKAKNIMFIPAAEISFANECKENSTRFKQYHNSVQCPELLAYGINPFSETSKDFFSTLHKKREELVEYAINQTNQKAGKNIVSKEEFAKHFLPQKKQYCMFGINWKIRNYLLIKATLEEIEAVTGKKGFAQQLFDEFMDNKQKFENKLSLFLNYKNLNYYEPRLGPEIIKISDKIAPKLKKLEQNELSGEYIFDDLTDYAKKEDAVLAFAHPLFTIQNYHPTEAYDKMQKFVEKSDGTLLCVEKYHQAYLPHITEEEKFFANSVTDRLNLINIGGRDNHYEDFIYCS